MTVAMIYERKRTMFAAAAALAIAVAGCGRDRAAPRPTTRPAGAPRAGDVSAGPLGMEFAYVPPGRFVMGSPVDEPGRHDDETQHEVTIRRGFWLGVTEVTQAQWQQAMSFNRSDAKGDDLPISKVSWAHAVAFCRKLSETGGRTIRLPTEAEWEYACRAGAAGPFAGSGTLDEMGWHMDNSDETPHPVARKKPNAWGLYDMHGSVAEWCSDWYERTWPPGPVADPVGPPAGKARVARGGSWGHFGRAARSAARASFNPAYPLARVGVRAVMENGEGRMINEK